MRKSRICLLALAIVATSCSSSSNTETEVNDVNTPLHLMRPNYEYGYGVPEVDSVRNVMERVLSYTSEAMPAAIDSEDRLVAGKFRLTTYECGVTYAAMINAANITGDNRYRQFAIDRLSLIADLAERVEDAQKKDPTRDLQMRRVLQPSALDDAGAMAAALIRLQLTGEQKSGYDKMIDRYVDWVMNKEFRLADGTLARNRPHSNTVWLDDMYMGVPCLAWYGKYKNDTKYTDEAIRQIKLFREKMWVPEVKLFRHGWVEDMRPHPAFHWGRANGWAILTMCEVLDALPSDHPERGLVLELLQQHIEGLCRMQDKTGMWHQLLDHPDTYLESSCTAIYTYCIAHAINEGWVDALTYGAQALLAWHAVSANVTSEGQIVNTCVGTGMGFDPAFYAYRPVHVMAAHGYGPVIWAGAEVIRLINTTHPKMNDSAIHFYRSEQKTDQPIFSENATQKEIF